MKLLRRYLRRPETRPVLLHLHLFKNAGTTVDWALERCLGKRFLTFDNLDDSGNIFTDLEFESFVKHERKAFAVSSHQVRMPLPVISRIKLLPMAFARHPVDRAFSVYHFERSHVVKTPSSTKAASLPVEDYFNWWLDRSGLGLINNFHLSIFGRINAQQPAAHVHEAADLARQRWEQLALAGVVDRLDESLTLAETKLRRFFPGLDLAFLSQNVSRPRQGSLEERVEKSCAELSAKTRERLWRRNREDMDFYQRAVSRLEEEISNIADFQNRLLDFRKRCRLLGKAQGAIDGFNASIRRELPPSRQREGANR